MMVREQATIAPSYFSELHLKNREKRMMSSPGSGGLSPVFPLRDIFPQSQVTTLFGYLVLLAFITNSSCFDSVSLFLMPFPGFSFVII